MIARLESTKVDVILLDLQMPHMDGLGVLRELQARTIHVPFTMLTTFDDEKQLRQCLELNAKGLMLKDVSFDQLVANIEKVAAGEYLPDQFPSSKATTTPDPLTPRERDILKYMADGYSNREIAEAIHLSEAPQKPTCPASS